MAQPVVAAPAAGDAAGPNAEGDAPPQTLFDRVFPFLRVILFWYLIQSVTGGGGPLTKLREAMSPPTADPIGDAATAATTAAETRTLGDVGDALNLHQHAPAQAQKGVNGKAVVPPLKTFRNAFQVGDMISLRVYVSPDEQFQFSSEQEQEQLRWWLKDIRYDPQGNPENEEGQWTQRLNVTVDDYLLSNGSLYAHVFLTKEGFSPNPEDSAYDRMGSIYRTIELTTFRPRDQITKKRNLLDSLKEEETETKEEETAVTDSGVDPTSYVSMWKPSFTINLVHDSTVYSANLKPPPFLATGMEIDHDAQLYLPVLYMNDFWILEEHLQPVNNSVTALPLELSFYPLHLYKFALYTQMEQNFQNQQKTGASTKKDTDKMKAMFIETNPYLLGITVCVSMLHSLFDFLAFKNDVSFWRNQKSLAGLSLRTIVLNTFFQLVIFLYLMDNDTSWMILMSSLISLLIEVWKIKKAIKISRDANNRIVITGEDSYNDSPTAEHDRVAVAHLSFVLYPLIVGHAFYTLTYGVHKGWYSWVVSSLTSFVYAFGFIMMTPQLYINYKLKSVAHLPWRAMVYKSLNTFIDDLFAFVIKMPWMHRLSCFRDDLIFFIYLYQRWKYPVDVTRTNEFGQGGPGEEEEAAAELANGTATAQIEAAVDASEGVTTEAESTEYLMSKRSKTLEQQDINNVD
ncbi:Cleft lip and palate transmembrane protein 1 [Globisporangium polare]